MRKVKHILIVFIVFWFVESNSQILFQGRVIKDKSCNNFERDSFRVYYNEKLLYKFQLKGKEGSCSISACKNVDKGFFCIQNTEYRSILLNVDSVGMVIDTICSVKRPYLVWETAISKKDSKLLFSILKKTSEHDFYAPLDLFVMDYKERKVIKKFVEIGTVYTFEISRLAWAQDENRFVYSVRNKSDSENGIFVFNILKDTYSKIINYGVSPSWSPKESIIFCTKIELNKYNLQTQQVETMIKVKEKRYISDYMLSPSGDYLYLDVQKTFGKGSIMYPKVLDLKLNKVVSVKDFIETCDYLLLN